MCLIGRIKINHRVDFLGDFNVVNVTAVGEVYGRGWVGDKNATLVVPSMAGIH